MSTHKRSVYLYLFSEILLSLGIGVVLYTQPFYYQSVGMADHTIGLLFAINSGATGITALLLGSVADRLGASRVFKVATLLLPLGYLATGMTHSFWLLAGATTIGGCGAALLLITENVVLSSLLSDVEKSHVLSRFVAMYTLVMAVGTFCAGPISQALGYDHTLLLGAGTALVAPLFRVFVKAPDSRSVQLFRKPTKLIWKMAVYAILFGCAIGIFAPFATLILQGHYGVDDRLTAAISALTLLFTSAGSFFVTPLLRRFAKPRTILYSFLSGIAITVMLAAGMPTAWSFASLLLLRTAVFSIPGSIVDATFLEWTEPTMHVQMFGVRVFGSSIGTAIGSYAGGVLLNAGALSPLYALSAAVCVAAWWYLRTMFRAGGIIE